MDAVEAGLRLVFAVAGEVKREDPECIRGLWSRRRDLYVLLGSDDAIVKYCICTICIKSPILVILRV